ncbi:MAG TPA: hypothetical protein VHZ32_00250 [Rhizomicrobium sp.]|jgi:hypothetical protein|nr:hypothetical protein [Rhizomicrobium sp.]
MRIAISLAIFAMLAAGASAQTAAPPADVPAAAPPPEAAVKIICARTPPETGSHLGSTKVCHTEAEWTTIHSQTDRMLQHYQDDQNMRDNRRN